jgi:hypothetical protein
MSVAGTGCRPMFSCFSGRLSSYLPPPLRSSNKRYRARQALVAERADGHAFR